MKAIPYLLVSILVALGGAAVFRAYIPFLANEGPSTETLRFGGVVVANEVVVSAKIGGRVARKYGREGDFLNEGDLIAVLERDELEAERQTRQAGIRQLVAKERQLEVVVTFEESSAEAQVRKARAELKVAQSSRDEADAELAQLERDVERTEKLLAKKLVPRRELEVLQTQVRSAQARLRSIADNVAAAQAGVDLAEVSRQRVAVARYDVEQCRAQIDQAEAEYSRVEARLRETEIRAPISALVSKGIVKEGEVVRAGDPILTLVDLNDIWVKTEVEEGFADRIAVGAVVSVELASGETLVGEVMHISPEAGFATRRDINRVKRDVRSFNVKVRLPKTERRLHPGMTAYVFLPTDPLDTTP